MQFPRTPRPTTNILNQAAPHEEVTEAVLWAGGWTASEVGITLMAGWSGAYLRLLHAQVMDEGADEPRLVDLLAEHTGLTKDEHGAVLLAPWTGAWWVCPPRTRGFTVQYAAPGGLSYLPEFRAL